MAEPAWKQAPLAGSQAGPRKQPLWAQAPEVSGEESASFSELVGGMAGQINRGILEAPGSLVDLVNAGTRRISIFGQPLGSDRPIGGTRQLGEAAQQFAPGLFPETPDTGLGRVTGRIGREVGRSVLPAAGILGRATQVPQAFGRTAPTLSQTFFNPIARTPGRAAAGELAAASGAGLGAGIAQEMAPGSVMAELTGEILGGLSPTVLASMPTSLALRGGSALARRITPKAQRARGRKMATELLGQELSPEAAEGLSEADALRRQIPGFNPTLGEATGSPALLANQRRIEAQATGQQLEAFAGRRQGSEQAVEQFAARQAPAAGDVLAGDVISEASRRLRVARGDIANELSEIDLNRTAVADELRPIDRAELGRSIRQTLRDRKTAVSEQMSQLADTLGISTADVSVDYARLREDILEQFTPGSVFEDTANIPQVVDAIRAIGPDTPITFQDLKSLRERVSDDLIDAMGRRSSGRKEIRSLVMLKTRIDEGINGLTAQADPDLADRYNQFRTQYFENYVTPFESGASFGVQARDSTGFFKTPDEKVAKAFFNPGDVSAAQQYRQIFANDPSAVADLQAVALDSLRDAAVRDGVVQPNLVTNWLRRHRSVLDEFPEITGEINNIFDADTAMRNRAQQLTARTKAIDEEILTREIDAFGRGSRTGESVLQSSLADPRKMGQLIKVVGKERLPELRRLLWKEAAAGSPEDMLTFMANNRLSLEQVFTPQHFKDLASIVAARTMLDRVPTPRGAAAIPRPGEDIERALGQGLPQLSSRLFALKSGRMQKGYLVVDTLLRGARGRAAAGADELLSEALYDPGIARDMITAMDIGRLRPPTANRLQARLFALPATVTQQEQPSEP